MVGYLEVVVLEAKEELVYSVQKQVEVVFSVQKEVELAFSVQKEEKVGQEVQDLMALVVEQGQEVQV